MPVLHRRRFVQELLAAVPALMLGDRPKVYRQASAGVVVRAGEDRYHQARGIGVSTTAFKVGARDTTGSMFSMEHSNSRKGGPPLHVHHAVDEFWYIVAGEYVFEIGSQRWTARAGDCVLGPRGIPHRWAFIGNTTGRVLITFTPAGRMEEWFSRPREPGKYATDATAYPDFGMELLGPPIDVS